jgi:hypothetical protein
MKTKLLFRTIQNCKNGIFTLLIIFFMTFYSFSQSIGISFDCGGGIISFEAPVENDLFNGYPYWVGGTDNFGSGVEYLLFVQEVNGDDRWEVHEAGEAIGNFPNNTNFGVLYFYSPDYNVTSPTCDNVEGNIGGSWIVEYNLLPCYPGTVFSTCAGEPVEVCPTYYTDADEDGFGSVLDLVGEEFCSDPGAGYSLTNDDCDDTAGSGASINPDATEVPYDGIDNDCNPATSDDDLDNDGFLNVDDCDDLEFDVYPGAPEICDGLDNNCDGQIDEGIDGCIDGVIIEYCDDKQKKILICHNGKTKCVSINAMDAHLAHGDYLGTCVGNSKEAQDIAEEVPTFYDVVSWPNPTRDSFNIRMSTPNTTDKVSMRAFDINGRLIHSNLINGNEDYQFGSQFNSGIYFVILSQADKTEVVKLIKQ